MKKSQVYIQPNDIELMRELYELRILSAKQINENYYNKRYGYERIKELETAGYLDSRPLANGRKKETQYYYLTSKGIELLKLDHPRPAYKNKINEDYLAVRQLMINEIYMILKTHDRIHDKKGTWTWRDSRSVKEEYKYNRRDLIAGELKNTITGEKYGVYIPTRTEKYEELCESYAREINKHDILRNNIVLCPDTGADKEIMRYFESNMPPAGLSLRVLPYPTGVNIIYNALTDRMGFMIETYQNIKKVHGELLKETSYLHATHETPNEYYAELLTNDIVLRKYIEKYTTDQRDTKSINLVCWSFHEEALKKRYRHGLSKISLFPQSWATSYITKGVSEESAYISQKINTRPKTERMMMSFTPQVSQYLKGMTAWERSELVNNLIILTDSYKKYVEEEKKNAERKANKNSQ